MAPIEFGCNDQAIEAVVLDLSLQHLRETLFKANSRFPVVNIGAGFVPQMEILNPERIVCEQHQLVGTLRVHINAHVFQDRQRVGQHQRFLITVNNKVHMAGFGAIRAIQIDRAHLFVAPHAIDATYVAARIGRVCFFLVAGREYVAVVAKQAVAFVLAKRAQQLFTDLVCPRNNHISDAIFDLLNADTRPLTGRCAHNKMYTGER